MPQERHCSDAARARASRIARMRACSASSRRKRPNTTAATRYATPGTNEMRAMMANRVGPVYADTPGKCYVFSNQGELTFKEAKRDVLADIFRI